MKFALFVHPRSLKQRWPRGLALAPGRSAPLQHVSKLLRGLAQATLDPTVAQGPEVVEPRLVICSAEGANAEARVFEIPLGTEEFLLDPASALESVRQAIDLARAWGAELIGLGGLCGYIGNGGQHLAERSPLPLTQGNSLAVFAVQQNLRLACAEADLDLADANVTIVGASGAVSSATARLLAPQVGRLTLATLDTLGSTAELANELQADLTGDIPAAVASADIVLVSAAEADGFDPADMQSGSILIDLDVTFDLLPPTQRRDILLVSGDACEVPTATPRDSLLLSLGHGVLTADLAEAMVLALADRAESFSLGNHVDPQSAEWIGRLALRQGFQFRKLCLPWRLLRSEKIRTRHRPQCWPPALRHDSVAISIRSSRQSAATADSPRSSCAEKGIICSTRREADTWTLSRALAP
ncbi:MAG: hypothetical protein K8T91_23510 [Planctomycetes bacterium]|nr:hypothetical protein [Planctomycetota bacterium]